MPVKKRKAPQKKWSTKMKQNPMRELKSNWRSLGPVGKLAAVSVGAGLVGGSGDDFIIKVKVNGQVIFGQRMEESTVIADGNDLKFIIPANCSLEVTLESSSGSRTWYVAGYGNYL